MKVFVTGYRGYIGQVLTPVLREEGHDLGGADTRFFESCRLPGAAAWEVHDDRPADIRDLSPADLAGYDAVIHLAGLCNDPLGDLDPSITARINTDATVRLAEAARRAGVSRFLFASSCSVYGSGSEQLIDEDHPPRPLTPYAVSKLRAEESLHALSDDTFCVTSLRLATVYGLSPLLRFDLVVNNLVAYACVEGRVVLKSDGSAWRPLFHVEDLARVYAAMLHAPAASIGGRAFNVGVTSENHRVRDLARAVAEETGARLEEPDAGAFHDHRSYRVACGRLLEVIPSFRPRWTLRLGIRQLEEALSGIPGLDAEQFEGPRFARVRHLRNLRDGGRISESFRWREREPAPAIPPER